MRPFSRWYSFFGDAAIQIYGSLTRKRLLTREDRRMALRVYTREYEEAIKIDPSRPEYHADLAEALLATSRYDESLKEFDSDSLNVSKDCAL